MQWWLLQSWYMGTRVGAVAHRYSEEGPETLEKVGLVWPMCKVLDTPLQGPEP